MTRLFVALALVGGALVVGCANGGSSDSGKADTPATSDDKNSDSDDTSSDGSDTKGQDAVDGKPTPVPSTGSPAASKDPPITDPDAPPAADPKPDPATPATQKGECPSTTGGHTSETKLEWHTDAGKDVITSFSVLVDNKDNRNKNDVDVFVTPPGGSEKKVMNSGDILVSGQQVPITWPAATEVTPGTKIRIQTNFDTAFIDPHASCTITL